MKSNWWGAIKELKIKLILTFYKVQSLNNKQKLLIS
jgi:hypothetical protein